MRSISAMFGIPYPAWKISIPGFIIQIINKNIAFETLPALLFTVNSNALRFAQLCKAPQTNDRLIMALNYPILWLVPVIAHTVFSTPDDGRKEHPKHVE
jgi:hypothetical protein